MSRVHAKAGDVSWGKDDRAEKYIGDCCLHSRVEMEKDEPRRKLPGGQSSPQSLRGMASIVVPMGGIGK